MDVPRDESFLTGKTAFQVIEVPEQAGAGLTGGDVAEPAPHEGAEMGPHERLCGTKGFFSGCGELEAGHHAMTSNPHETLSHGPEQHLTARVWGRCVSVGQKAGRWERVDTQPSGIARVEDPHRVVVNP